MGIDSDHGDLGKASIHFKTRLKSQPNGSPARQRRRVHPPLLPVGKKRSENPISTPCVENNLVKNGGQAVQ